MDKQNVQAVRLRWVQLWQTRHQLISGILILHYQIRAALSVRMLPNGSNTDTYTPPSGTAGIYFYYCSSYHGACPTTSNRGANNC